MTNMKTPFRRPLKKVSGQSIRSNNISEIFTTTIYGMPLIAKVYSHMHRSSIKHYSGVEKCHKVTEIRTREILKELTKRI